MKLKEGKYTWGVDMIFPQIRKLKIHEKHELMKKNQECSLNFAYQKWLLALRRMRNYRYNPIL